MLIRNLIQLGFRTIYTEEQQKKKKKSYYYLFLLDRNDTDSHSEKMVQPDSQHI